MVADQILADTYTSTNVGILLGIEHGVVKHVDIYISIRIAGEL